MEKKVEATTIGFMFGETPSPVTYGVASESSYFIDHMSIASMLLVASKQYLRVISIKIQLSM